MNGVFYFLNVREGDCNIIRHDNGHVTVIDVCNGNADEEDRSANESYSIFAKSGNYHQKDHPIDPIGFMNDIGIKSIFRFILTHPDMDHMDGIERLFNVFNVTNFWDTDNNKEMGSDSKWGCYKESDWDFYQSIRKSEENPKVLQLLDGEEREYFNKPNGGDGLYILGPSQNLVDESNEKKDYNNLSYVLLYKTHGRKIIFGGDSESKEWDFILDNYEEDVSDVDILIAPHHGRFSGGNDDYLDVLKPKLTLFGNASSKDLDYDSWNRRGLKHYTNNEGGSFALNTSYQYGIEVYCDYEKFAKSINTSSYYKSDIKGWYMETIY